jgi:hypothetical protein
MSLGLKVFFHAVDTMIEKLETDAITSKVSDPKKLFNYDLNCQGVNSNHRWENGPQFYRFRILPFQNGFWAYGYSLLTLFGALKYFSKPLNRKKLYFFR